MTAEERAPYKVEAEKSKAARQANILTRATAPPIHPNHYQNQIEEADPVADILANAKDDNEDFAYVNYICQDTPLEDLLKKKFYLMAFNVLCKTNKPTTYYPNELGIVEFSVKDGVTNKMHWFLDPCHEVPLGVYNRSKLHADASHKIPLTGFAQAAGLSQDKERRGKTFSGILMGKCDYRYLRKRVLQLNFHRYD